MDKWPDGDVDDVNCNKCVSSYEIHRAIGITVVGERRAIRK